MPVALFFGKRPDVLPDGKLLPPPMDHQHQRLSHGVNTVIQVKIVAVEADLILRIIKASKLTHIEM